MIKKYIFLLILFVSVNVWASLPLASEGEFRTNVLVNHRNEIADLKSKKSKFFWSYSPLKVGSYMSPDTLKDPTGSKLSKKQKRLQGNSD